MNTERIQELAYEAENYADTMVNGGSEFHPVFVNKFAELIVREVFAKIEGERFEIYQPVKESVMKHFGVES